MVDQELAKTWRTAHRAVAIKNAAMWAVCGAVSIIGILKDKPAYSFTMVLPLLGQTALITKDSRNNVDTSNDSE